MRSFLFAVTSCIIFILVVMPGVSFSQDGPYYFNQYPEKGKVTMIDLGADYCVPCKMMAPILKKIKKQYKEKADIIFIDVSENKLQAERFGVRVIPTQVFFDADKKEIYRHEGFMSEADIVSRLKSMGIQ